MQSGQEPVVRVRSLRKCFDRFALDIPSLEIGQGEVVGLIGENGAGKSTLIKLLLGVIPSDGGEIGVFGQQFLTPALRERIGVAFDQCWFSAVLNLRDVEAIMRGLYPRTWDQGMFCELAEKLGLPERQRIAEYSSGMKAKLGILSSICHAPDLLVLDEPTNSLDPVMRHDVNRMIQDFGEAGGKTVLFSSHIVNELEDFVDRILLMKGGTIVLDSRMDALQTDYCVGSMSLAEAPFGAPDNAVAVLREGGNISFLLHGAPQGPWEALRVEPGVRLDGLMYFFERGERA
ncbi:ABC transporter ATP-binding protein [Tractidigestivibacter sp.]|uniref:ABC transporter ATP-binding protein n=1 Tax=Tractidigestivibacter sp. TaxID=2847320 RepID=UPI002A91C3AD|nr:ABC transporter ATP-binding protein [Tractidigestivibacter sp.]MDY5272358.1 ABC transporter ATP-binding protein [Tractidigestivibacter sp.]